MKKLIQTAVEYPVTLFMIILAILLLGYISFDRLGVDLFPSLESPKLYVTLKTGEKPPEGSGLAREEFAEALRKSQGDLPAGLRREFDRATPKVKWTLYVRSKIMSAVGKRSKFFTYTKIPIYSRACLKRGIRIPGVLKCSTQVVAAIDTSGSISKEELSQFMAELEQLKRVVSDLYVYVCDADIHQFYHNPVFPIEVKGGGGTDFRGLFKDVEERRLSPAILVYFTDGWGTFPDRAPSYPVLWVVVEGPDTIGVEFPFGRVIMI